MKIINISDRRKIKMVNIDFAFTTFLAFLMNLRFNNSRKMNICILKEYRSLFIKKFLDSCSSSEKFVVNDIDNYDDFIRNYHEYFNVHGEYLVLNENIKTDDIENILESFNVPNLSSAICVMRYDLDLKNFLGLDGIHNLLQDYLKIERELENCYLNFQNKEEELVKIRKLLNVRNTFYFEILKKGHDYLDDCQADIYGLDMSEPYQDFYPVNTDMYLDEEQEELLEELLTDSYAYAIFSRISLAPSRMIEDVQNLDFYHTFLLPDKYPNASYEERLELYIKDNALENGGFVSTNRLSTEEYYYLTYIKKLDELQMVYGKNNDLEFVKRRLLYLLDNSSSRLLDNDKFDYHYNKVFNNLESDDDYSIWYPLIVALISDIFASDEQTLIKLAMISTYYSLTKDVSIYLMLQKYKSNPKYKEYIRVIKEEGIKLSLKK